MNENLNKRIGNETFDVKCEVVQKKIGVDLLSDEDQLILLIRLRVFEKVLKRAD